MVSIQFDTIMRANAVVTFTDARAARAVRELASVPGVLAAEGQRVVLARINAGNRTYRLGLTGISETADLNVPRDASLKRIEIPADGLALSRRLARRLGVRAGDTVWVEVMEGSRPSFPLTVASLVDDVIGMNAYMRIDNLNRLMGDDDLISQAALLVDPDKAPSVWRELNERPRIAAIGVKSAWLKSFHETVGNLVLISAIFLTGFGLIIVVGMVYNTARVAFHERGWELASLRVLGFTEAEVSRILLAELGVAVLLAMPLASRSLSSSSILSSRPTAARVSRSPRSCGRRRSQPQSSSCLARRPRARWSSSDRSAGSASSPP